MGAQTVAKTPVGRNDNVVVLLKGDKYALTNEPLGKSVIENIDNQIARLERFTSCFHSIEVIGLHHKDTNEKNNGKAQKVRRIVHYFLK